MYSQETVSTPLRDSHLCDQGYLMPSVPSGWYMMWVLASAMSAPEAEDSWSNLNQRRNFIYFFKSSPIRKPKNYWEERLPELFITSKSNHWFSTMCKVCKLPSSNLQNSRDATRKGTRKQCFAYQKVRHSNLLTYIKLDYSSAICKPLSNYEIHCWQVVENDTPKPQGSSVNWYNPLAKQFEGAITSLKMFRSPGTSLVVQ